MKKQYTLYLHIFIWFYWLLIYLILYDYNNYVLAEDKTGFLMGYIFCRGSVMAIFYVHYWLFIPHFLMKNRIVLYAIFTVVSVYLGMAFHSYVWHGYDLTYFFYWERAQWQALFFEDFYPVLFPLALILLQEWLPSEIRKSQLKEELKYTELQFLKSQMSPHFLFNTLNNIYGLSLIKDQKTPNALSQLKNIMSYVEFMESGNQIRLRKEIAFLNDFISLNKLRYKTKITFDIDSQLDQEIEMEPMLLLPLIENAFKHGVNGVNGFLNIGLIRIENKLSFKVENDFDLKKRKDTVSGVGLKNIRRRLEMIYQNDFEFNQVIDGSIFISYLIIPLNEK